MAGAFGNQRGLHQVRGGGCQAGLLELVDPAAADRAGPMRLLQQVFAGHVDHQLIVLPDQLVRVPRVGHHQQHQARVGGIHRRLPTDRHEVGLLHGSARHQDDAAGLDKPLGLIQRDSAFHRFISHKHSPTRIAAYYSSQLHLVSRVARTNSFVRVLEMGQLSDRARINEFIRGTQARCSTPATPRFKMVRVLLRRPC